MRVVCDGGHIMILWALTNTNNEGRSDLAYLKDTTLNCHILAVVSKTLEKNVSCEYVTVALTKYDNKSRSDLA